MEIFDVGIDNCCYAALVYLSIDQENIHKC